jgi:hypothetical protein
MKITISVIVTITAKFNILHVMLFQVIIQILRLNISTTCSTLLTVKVLKVKTNIQVLHTHLRVLCAWNYW